MAFPLYAIPNLSDAYLVGWQRPPFKPIDYSSQRDRLHKFLGRCALHRVKSAFTLTRCCVFSIGQGFWHLLKMGIPRDGAKEEN
jgi:hypothetical protein